jgi:adenylate cyclase
MVLAPMIGIKCARGRSRNKTRVVQFPRQTIRAAIHAALTPMQLPTRVWRDFEREQYRSELLVTAVHLLIAALLAVLYASSPPGFSPDAPIRAVPLDLTLLSVLSWFAFISQ